MFIGHLALGLAAKRIEPRVSLALLFVAAQFADLLWPVLVAFGVEQVRIDPGNTAFTPLDFVSYLYSHSLVFLLMWGVALGVVCRWLVSSHRAIVVVMAGLVVSHWVLDFVTHRPDMPFYPGGPRVGLGLWNSIPATLTVECALFAVGVWTYLRTTEARDAIGRWAFAALAAFLVIGYVAAVGSVPPSIPALYIAALVGAAANTLELVGGQTPRSTFDVSVANVTEQNTHIIVALTRTSAAFASRGYDVILDGLFVPQFLPVIASELRSTGLASTTSSCKRRSRWRCVVFRIVSDMSETTSCG
jgi:hypothetical protein